MLIIPAIDLKDGNAVRLYKGDYNKKTIYSKEPEKLAIEFEKIGANYLHVVDLDGAKIGTCGNLETIKKIKNNISIPIEVGGGIRNIETVDLYLNKIGIDRVIIGTAAIQDKTFLRQIINKYGAEKIIVGVDINNGNVAISGWLEDSKINYLDFIKELENIGVKYIVVTDISKDGTLSGPNFELYENIKNNSNIKFVVSGGIKNNENIYKTAELGYYGCIVGKAYYEKTVDLVEVLKCLKKE